MLGFRLFRRLGDILFVPAKSMQKPREQKNSSDDCISKLASVASVFHVYDFLPLLRRVIRKSCCSALGQFLLTFPKIKITTLVVISTLFVAVP